MLSYPGVAFSFKIPEAAAKNLHKSDDFINYLSSSTAPQCCSMALFRGNSWSEVKDDIFAETESFEPSESAEPVIHFADIDVCVFCSLGLCVLTVNRRITAVVCSISWHIHRAWLLLT